MYNKDGDQKKRIMYNRDWKKVERYFEDQVLGFSVQYVVIENHSIEVYFIK